MIKKILLFSIVLLSFVCCGIDSPVNSGSGDAAPDDRPAESIFDYSKMGEHPRLLLRVDDFARMQASIDSDSRLVAGHKAIMDRSDYHLDQGPITYVKVGKRLLNESRRALERILFLSYSYRMTGES